MSALQGGLQPPAPAAPLWTAAHTPCPVDVEPWRCGTAMDERERCRATLDVLLRDHYRAAFEPGCASGVLTARLARLCGTLLASDTAPPAVEEARRRCADQSHIDIRCQGVLASCFPPGPFDLIVFNELACHFSSAALAAVARRVHEHLEAGGEFIAVHGTGRHPQYRLQGSEVHRLLRQHLQLDWLGGTRLPGFRIDSWIKS